MAAPRAWMYNRRLPGGGVTDEFKAGVDSFLDFAFANNVPPYSGKIPCPCRRCQFRFFHKRDEVLKHLYRQGFESNYYVWTYHGTEYECQNMHTYVGESSAHPHRLSNTPADAKSSSQASVNAPPHTTVDPDLKIHLQLDNIQRLMEEVAAGQRDATLRQGTVFSAEDIKRLVHDAMEKEMASFRAEIEHKMKKRLDTIEEQQRAGMVKIEEQRMKDKEERHKIEEDRAERYMQRLQSMEDLITGREYAALR